MMIFSILCLATILRMVFVLVTERLTRSATVHENSILRLVRPDKQIRREWLSIPVTLAIDLILIYVLIRQGLINVEGDLALWQCAAAFLGHFVLLEFFYYWLHRAQHTFPLLYKTHAKHHKSVIPTPSTSLTFTILDRLSLAPLFVTPVVLFSQLFGAFPLWLLLAAVAFHDLLNTLGHVNREFTPKWYRDSILSRIIYTPTHHTLHHTRQAGNYSLFMPVWDLLFKTDFKDAHAIADEAIRGNGLAALRGGPRRDETQP